MSTENKAVTRRTIAKGAAWSLPVIATAAAAPAASASTNPPTCTPCLSGGLAAISLATSGRIRRNTGSFTQAGAFTALATNCTGLISGGILTVTAARLTMSDGNVYTTTGGLGGGVMVAGATVLADGVTFDDVHYPNGGVPVPTYASVYPKTIAFDVTYPLLVGGVRTMCGQTLTFQNTITLGAGAVAGGNSRLGVSYATVWTFLG